MNVPRNGARDFLPDSGGEWIELERLREIIAEMESLGGSRITPVDLLNRLGIADDEIEMLRSARAIAAASGRPPMLPGAPDPRAPGRRTASRQN